MFGQAAGSRIRSSARALPAEGLRLAQSGDRRDGRVSLGLPSIAVAIAIAFARITPSHRSQFSAIMFFVSVYNITEQKHRAEHWHDGISEHWHDGMDVC